MTQPRSFYQCHKTGCDSAATNQMWLRFHTLGRDLDLTCNSSIKVCDRHKRQAEEYVATPENKTAISMKFLFERLPPPDFSSLKCVWVPVVDGMAVEGAA